MRVFVTGATGFIGRHLVRHLLKHGHEVHGLVRTPSKATALASAGMRVVPGDLDSITAADAVLPQADVVVHLAGVVAAQDGDYARINEQAVRAMIQTIERQSWTPRRFLLASSLAAAGPSTPDRPLMETDEPRPVDAYGVAKAHAEDIVRSAPFPTTSFRPCIVMGPEDTASLTLYQLASRGHGFAPSGPVQPISFIDVDDVVTAIVAMANDTSNTHRCYFVSHPEPTDNVAMWGPLGEAVGKKVHVHRIPRGALWAAMKVASTVSPALGLHNQLDEKQYLQITAPAFVCSSAALSRDLGWTAKVSLAESFLKAVNGYRAAGML
jgi:dihydroflavonol-4-reductase